MHLQHRLLLLEVHNQYRLKRLYLIFNQFYIFLDQYFSHYQLPDEPPPEKPPPPPLQPPPPPKPPPPPNPPPPMRPRPEARANKILDIPASPKTKPSMKRRAIPKPIPGIIKNPTPDIPSATKETAGKRFLS